MNDDIFGAALPVGGRKAQRKGRLCGVKVMGLLLSRYSLVLCLELLWHVFLPQEGLALEGWMGYRSKSVVMCVASRLSFVFEYVQFPYQPQWQGHVWMMGDQEEKVGGASGLIAEDCATL